MTTVSSRKVLVIGSANGLGEMLCQQFEFGNLPSKQITLENIDWTSQSAINKNLNALNPVLLVNLFPLDFSQADKNKNDAVLTACKMLLKVCSENKLAVLQLSNALVFSHGDSKSYDENEEPCTKDKLGKLILQCETQLQKLIEQHLLLRFSWVIDAQGDNIFTQFLQELDNKNSIKVNAHVKGAPIWKDDALRVVLALVRQCLAGSENWGVFHYASSDACTEKEFGQQLLDTFNELQPERLFSLSENNDEKIKSSAVLKCKRIRNNFGIHGRTWRQGLKYRIQYWLEGRWLEKSPQEEGLEHSN